MAFSTLFWFSKMQSFILFLSRLKALSSYLWICRQTISRHLFLFLFAFSVLITKLTFQYTLLFPDLLFYSLIFYLFCPSSFHSAPSFPVIIFLFLSSFINSLIISKFCFLYFSINTIITNHFSFFLFLIIIFLLYTLFSIYFLQLFNPFQPYSTPRFPSILFLLFPATYLLISFQLLISLVQYIFFCFTRFNETYPLFSFKSSHIFLHFIILVIFHPFHPEYLMVCNSVSPMKLDDFYRFWPVEYESGGQNAM